MIANLILAVCMLVAGSCLGIKFSEKYTEKFSFYKSLCDFNGDFMREVSFFKNNLKYLYCKQYSSVPFCKILSKKHSDGEIKDELPSFLNEMQKQDVLSYFDKIGKTDAPLQVSLCEGYSSQFEKELELSRAEMKKYGGLYKKTGFLIGLIAFVILV